MGGRGNGGVQGEAVQHSNNHRTRVHPIKMGRDYIIISQATIFCFVGGCEGEGGVQGRRGRKVDKLGNIEGETRP